MAKIKRFSKEYCPNAEEIPTHVAMAVFRLGSWWIYESHAKAQKEFGIPSGVRRYKLEKWLKVENPEKYVEQFAKAGADILTFHYEAVENEELIPLINKIKSLGTKAGISIKPKTAPQVLEEFLPLVDLVLVMTVEPGFGGQKFMSDCADKIEYIKKYAKNELIIQVDGGINAQTGKICTQKGATSLVAGSYIYGAADKKAAIESLKN